MKKMIKVLLATMLILAFGVFALGSGESDSEPSSQGSGEATEEKTEETSLGDYSVVVDSCRLAQDYEGKALVIVKYIFTNNSNDTATSFMTAFDETVYQNGVGLNESWFVGDSANYSSDNQTKEIKKGSSLEVEVAYELNDTTTDIEVEVQELFSFDDKTITKTFTIAQ